MQETEQPVSEEKISTGETERKMPAWAIMLAIAAFLIVNAMFLFFAMSMTSGAHD